MYIMSLMLGQLPWSNDIMTRQLPSAISEQGMLAEQVTLLYTAPTIMCQVGQT